MKESVQRVWSSLVIASFTALTFLVLSYSPAVLAATGSGGEDCVVSPDVQMEGYCCMCHDQMPAFCNKVLFQIGYDRCQGNPVWCPDEVMTSDGTPG